MPADDFHREWKAKVKDCGADRRGGRPFTWVGRLLPRGPPVRQSCAGAPVLQGENCSNLRLSLLFPHFNRGGRHQSV